MEVCGIPPSRTVGVIKEAIEEAILDGVIPNEHDAAMEYLLRVKDELIQKIAENGYEKRRGADVENSEA
jgi:poly(A) polymerase